MEITFASEDGAALASLRGEVDADNCHRIGRELLAGAEGTGGLIVDLAQLTFIDSSGISELLKISEAVRDRNQRFETRNPSPPVRRILEITGLLEHFELN